jgi:hypothetical protein
MESTLERSIILLPRSQESPLLTQLFPTSLLLPEFWINWFKPLASTFQETLADQPAEDFAAVEPLASAHPCATIETNAKRELAPTDLLEADALTEWSFVAMETIALMTTVIPAKVV